MVLGRWLDALVSLGVIGLSIGLNVAQEMLARRRLKDVEQAARPRATLIREARARSVDASRIVRGDILVAGRGDQILVDGQVIGDGQIVVDESMLTGDSRRQEKRAGDMVYAGSFCITGRAAYKAQKVGNERLIVALTGESLSGKQELTTLERIVDRVLRVLLLFVALLAAILLLRFLQWDSYLPMEADPVIDAFNSAASMIFNIAPAGLFFVAVVTYAMGTADLAKLGALVHRARSAESLAQTNVSCFAQAGILTGTHVEVTAIEPPEGLDPLAESKLRQILGHFAGTLTMQNQVTRAMITTFPGNRRAVREETPFFALNGWSGIVVDHDDLRGVYVLGDPEILQTHLLASTSDAAETEDEDEAKPSAWRRAVAPLGRLLRRSQSPVEMDAAEESPSNQKESIDQKQEPPLPVEKRNPSGEVAQPIQEVGAAHPSQEAGSAQPRILERLTDGVSRLTRREVADAPLSREDDTPRTSIFGRAASRINQLVRREKPTPAQEGEQQDTVTDETILLFAYCAEATSLHDAAGQPKLPDGLVPLCTLRYTERVRPEAIQTIQGFSGMGMCIKILTSGPPEKTITILQEAGLGQENEALLQVISGQEWFELEPAERAQAASESSICGEVTPENAGQVVQALRQGGQSVAVVGDGINGMPALRQANLAIVRQSSSQAALSMADIVVLEDSPLTLLRVLDKGQRIVNGLLDILKPYLTQVSYLLFLTVAIPLLARGFPYHSSQGSVIALATVSIPSVVLTLWAVAGILPSADLGWRLTRFVGPAALTMGVAATVVYISFLESTGQVAYAQLRVNHVLVAMGLVLVIFIKPPPPFWSRGRSQPGDWRPTLIAMVLFALFLMLTSIHLGQLRQASDYGFVVLVAIPGHLCCAWPCGYFLLSATVRGQNRSGTLWPQRETVTSQPCLG